MMGFELGQTQGATAVAPGQVDELAGAVTSALTLLGQSERRAKAVGAFVRRAMAFPPIAERVSPFLAEYPLTGVLAAGVELYAAFAAEQAKPDAPAAGAVGAPGSAATAAGGGGDDGDDGRQ